MADVLAELLVKIRADTTGLETGLGKAENATQGFIQRNAKAFRAAGIAVTAFGAAITGVLVLAIKSAAEEQAGIQKLSIALKNVGVNYDDVKKSLEGVIAATQRKTAIADDAQREALAQLVATTGDYNKALKLLPLVLDLAAAKGMDLVSSAQVIGRVAQGNTTILARYGIQLKEGATATEALGILQQKYAGQAEAYGKSVAGQFASVKNNINDLMEAIGSTILPVIGDLLSNYVIPFIEKLKAWADAHPELTKNIVIVAGALGGLALVMGPILLMLPGLVAAYTLWKTVMLKDLIPAIAKVVVALWAKVAALYASMVAMGPAGWATAAAAMIIMAAGIAVITLKAKNAIASFTDEVNAYISPAMNATATTEEWVTALEAAKTAGQELTETDKELLVANNELKQGQEELATAQTVLTQRLKTGNQEEIEYVKAAIKAKQNEINVFEARRDEIAEQVRAEHSLQNAIGDTAQAVELSTDEMINNLKDYTNEAKRRASEVARVQIDAIDQRMDAERDAHSERMSALSDEYNAAIKSIDAQLGIVLAGYQSQIDAIDAQIGVAEKADKERLNNEKIASLKSQILTEKDTSKKADIQQELNDFLLDLEKERTREELEDRKDALRQQMDMARKQSQDAQDNARTTYNANRDSLEKSYNALTSNLQREKTARETALQEQLARYDKDLKKFNETIDLELLSTEDFVKKYNELLDQLKDKTIIVTTVQQTLVQAQGGATYGGVTPYAGMTPANVAAISTLAAQYAPWGEAYAVYSNYQHGGIAWTPQIASLAETEPELITPLSKLGGLGGNVTINFTEPVFFDREDSMNKFVDKISKVLDRKYRLAGRSLA